MAPKKKRQSKGGSSQAPKAAGARRRRGVAHTKKKAQTVASRSTASSARSAIKGFGDPATVSLRILAADRLLALGADKLAEDLGADIGEVDYDGFLRALDGLVKAGWATVEYREAESTPIGGRVWEEGDYYSAREGAREAFEKAYAAWRASRYFSAEIDELLEEIPPGRRPPPAPAPPKPEPAWAPYYRAAQAGDVEKLLELLQALDLRAHGGRREDFERAEAYFRAPLWRPDEGGSRVEAELARRASVPVVCRIARGYGEQGMRELIGSRIGEVWRETVDDVRAMQPGDAGASDFYRLSETLIRLAAIQSDPLAAFSELKAIGASWMGSEMEGDVRSRGHKSVPEFLKEIDIREGQFLQETLGPAGTLDRIERGPPFRVDFDPLLTWALGTEDRSPARRLARLCMQLTTRQMLGFLDELVRRGWHDVVDVALLAHDQRLGRKAADLVRGGYLPSEEAARALRAFAATWDRSPEVRAEMVAAADVGEARRNGNLEATLPAARVRW
jgi:hypothetical protein